MRSLLLVLAFAERARTFVPPIAKPLLPHALAALRPVMIAAAALPDDGTRRWIGATLPPLAALFAFDTLVRRTVGKTAPPALVGMLSLFFLLSKLLPPSMASGLQAYLAPAATLLNSWTPAFWVPPIVLLPFAISSMGIQAKHMITIILLAIVGLVANLGIAGWAAQCAAGGCVIAAGDVDSPTPDSPPEPPPTPYSLVQAQRFLLLVCASTALTAITLLRTPSLLRLSLARGLAHALAATSLGAATLGGLATGQLLPKRVQAVLNPFFASAGATFICTLGLATALGTSPSSVINTYYLPSVGSGSVGAGTVLSRFLGPTNIAYSLPMYAFRAMMAARARQLISAVFATASSSLLLSALASRLFRLPTPLNVALMPRGIAIPFASEACAQLGIPVSLGLLPVFITGLSALSYAPSILTAMRVRDPVARGLAAGCASHGGGILSVTPETEALPFAVVGMALTGAATVALLCVPSVRHLLLVIAGATAV